MAKKKNKIQKKEVKAEDRPVNQFLWLVAFMVVLILAIFLVPMLYHQIFEKFKYGGVPFEKTKTGAITFYHGIFPITYKGNLSAIYNSYFRTDPRKNNVSINTNFSLSDNVIISLEPGINECRSMILASPQLASFIHAFPVVKNISSGLNNEAIAKAMNISFVDCRNASKSTVIIIQKSNSTSSIDSSTPGCYQFNIANCEYLETIERYMMGVMAQVNNIKI